MYFNLIIICLNFVFVLANPCDHSTCGGCIRDSYGCKWCSQDNLFEERCISSNTAFAGCDPKNVVDPKSDGRAADDTRLFSSDEGQVVQLSPQTINLKLRPGQPHTFEFEFKAAEDYPADLYFIIDESSTMQSVKLNIASKSSAIYNHMKNKTKNILIGIGYFVDKNAMPFVMRSRTKNETYSYNNILQLTNDENLFEEKLRQESSGINYDKLEGGFDALAQAMACEDLVGWRNESRKIILFFTDEISHAAGDGLWAGITTPFDGKCYSNSGSYENELKMDYPSISMINYLAVQKEITIIFVVEDTGTIEETYKSLNIKGTKTLTFQKDSTIFKFEDTLTSIYEELSHNIQLKIDMASEDRKYFKIDITPNCVNDIKDNNCTVKNEAVKKFSGTIQLKEYYGKNDTKISILVSGIKEKLTLNVNVIKDCQCETTDVVRNSPDCKGRGSKMCGICECGHNWSGHDCSCKETSLTLDDSPNCRNNSVICNNRGNCLCGVCKCFDGFVGRLCEYNKMACPKDCSGHGECYRDQCVCAGGWTGNACDCAPGPCKTTLAIECNGRGSCECGSCHCHSIEKSWDARPAQDPDTCVVAPCPECHENQCRLLKDCAICHYNNNDCSVCHPQINVTVAKDLERTHDSFLCDNIRPEMGCYTHFLYRYRETDYGIDVVVHNEADCLESYYWVGGIFLGTLILAGLISLLAWKLVTEARDRREFEQFLKMHGGSAGATQNPLYTAPTVAFRNPAFRKKSVDFR